MKHNIRIAKELVRLANELLSQNEDQAIAEAVAKINSVLDGDMRTAAFGLDARSKSIILGTLTTLAFMFGLGSVGKAVQQSMIDAEEKERIESHVRFVVEDSIKGSKWLKDERDNGIVHEVPKFSRIKIVNYSNKFYYAVGTLNKNGTTILSVYEGNKKEDMVYYPPIAEKTVNIKIEDDNPGDKILDIADEMILDKLLD